MKECQNCGEETLYDRRNGKRCFKCGWTWNPETGLIEERPSKPHNADCGELLHNLPNDDDALPKMIEPLCVDGTCCSFNPKSMTKSNGKWIAACTHHKD